MSKTVAQIEAEADRQIAIRKLVAWYCGHQHNEMSVQFAHYLSEQNWFSKMNRLYASRHVIEPNR